MADLYNCPRITVNTRSYNTLTFFDKIEATYKMSWLQARHCMTVQIKFVNTSQELVKRFPVFEIFFELSNSHYKYNWWNFRILRIKLNPVQSKEYFVDIRKFVPFKFFFVWWMKIVSKFHFHKWSSKYYTLYWKFQSINNIIREMFVILSMATIICQYWWINIPIFTSFKIFDTGEWIISNIAKMYVSSE